MGEKWPVKFSHTIRFPRNCRKVATWDRRLYFPSEGRHAENFFICKICRLRPGLNPRTWVPEASMLTTRPAFLKVWSADHKWSTGSILVVLLD
jgi:hypothetical protein